MRLQFGPQPVYLVSHPDYLQRILRDNYQNYRKPDLLYAAAREVVGQGLVTSTGEVWLRQRRMIQPHLHRKQLVHLFDEMQEAVTEVLNRWEGLAQNHSEVEMGDKMAEITTNIITRTMFSRESFSLGEINAVGQCAIRLVQYVSRSLFTGLLPNPTGTRPSTRRLTNSFRGGYLFKAARAEPGARSGAGRGSAHQRGRGDGVNERTIHRSASAGVVGWNGS